MPFRIKKGLIGRIGENMRMLSEETASRTIATLELDGKAQSYHTKTDRKHPVNDFNLTSLFINYNS